MNRLQQKFNKSVKALRKKIPKQYNQVELLDYVANPDFDLLVSITTRADGKTYNYFNTMIRLALEYDDFKLMVIVRHHTLQDTMAENIDNILAEQGFEPDAVYFKRLTHYIMLYIDNKPILIISDLNKATDLKQSSAILKGFRFIIYDEFLALESSYQPDEPQKLQTIYESIDRGDNQLLPNPKILLLGNPVNFSSPLLSYWGLFDMLEKQPMNSVMTNRNIVQERFKNDNINDKKNKRLFTDNNGSISGEFRVNKILIVPPEQRVKCTSMITVKLRDEHFLNICYNPEAVDPYDFFIQVSAVPTNTYDYCLRLSDINPKAILLTDEKYTHPSYRYDFEKQKILFSDTFSINYVDNNDFIMYIDITGLIAKRKAVALDDPYNRARVKEQVSEHEQLEALKQRLALQYGG